MSAALPLHVLEAAAAWYVDLRDADQADALHDAHRKWLAESRQHRRAWARVEELQARMDGAPNGLGSALNDARLSRRQAIGALSLVLIAGSGGVAWHRGKEHLSGLTADYATATGERQDITLADGGQLQLNTATTVDVDYGARLREVRLHKGEVHIQTAQDTHARPFIVHTRHGSVRALGTRFLVKTGRQQSQVAVLEHAVEVRAAEFPQQTTKIAAGRQLQFDRRRTWGKAAITDSMDAWIRGLLVVSNWRLADFIEELSRYHRGYLGCHNSIADLRISGAFRLDDTQAVLENLTSTLPITLRSFTPYIVRLEPRA